MNRGIREHACCEICRKPFTRRVADRKRGWAKCCSKSCAALLRERGPRPTAPRGFGGSMTRAIEVLEPLHTGGQEFSFFDDKDDRN